MKKLLSVLFGAALFVSAICGFAACNLGDKDSEAVSLVALSGAADVIARDDVDYFVVPEPAASLRVKATANSENKLNFVGNLQQLYGGENGYPQAVIVAKNSLLESKALGSFVEAVKRNSEWLADENTQISTVVSAVSSHLTEGMTPSFNANNLTKQVIENCGIKFAYAGESKEEAKSFLTALKAVQPNVKDSPADKFFWSGNLPAEGSAFTEISVYAPDGAPALAIAGLMAGEIEVSDVAETIKYSVVNATTIQTFVTGESPKADICILPVNLAANLLGGGEQYTMLGTVTHGNLFLISAKTNESVTAENISSLKGKTVGVINLGAVPGLTFKLILNKYGIKYVDPSEE